MEPNADNAEQHLRAASDAILLLVTEVEQLERHKRGVPPGERRFDELARSVRMAAEALADFTREEEAWARGASATGRSLEPIAVASEPSTLSDILRRWRDVERRLEAADPGSAEATSLFDEFARLRDEYMAAFRARHGD